MEQDNNVKVSPHIFKLIANINAQRMLPNSIIETLKSALENLNPANDYFDEIYDTTSIDGLKQLLAAKEQRRNKAFKSIIIGLQQIDFMNDNFIEYYQEIDKIREPVLQMEARITQYEADLAAKEIIVRDLEKQLDEIKNPSPYLLLPYNDEDPIPDPSPDFTPGQINYRNSRYVSYACNRIKYSQPITVNNFNNLVRITIKNPDGCAKNSISGWRQKVMDAYAWKTMAVGPYRNNYTEEEYLQIMRCIRTFVKNNAVGAVQVPDHL